MRAVAPTPALSTHPYRKLLGFLAFSHPSSLFQHSNENDFRTFGAFL